MKLKLLVPFVFVLFCGCSNTQQSIDIVPELYDSELKKISTENNFLFQKIKQILIYQNMQERMLI